MRSIFCGFVNLIDFIRNWVNFFGIRSGSSPKPTPTPANYSNVQSGDSISNELLSFLGMEANDQIFIHFYNFDCPCSRFNIKEFQHLVTKYDSKVKFLAVLETIEKEESEIQEFRKKYDLGIDIPFR